MAFFPMIDLGSSMSNGYWRTCCFMRWNSSYWTAGRSKRIISGDHWNFSGILQLILASPKSRALSCLSITPQCKTSLFIKWAPIVVWVPFHCLWLQTLIFFPSMVDLSQGSSMSSGYSRTFCFMRRDSSFSTARRSEGIVCDDHWNLSGILQLLFLKASPKSRALSCLSSAPRCKTSLFIKWAPLVVWMSFHSFLLQTLIFFPSMVDLSQGSSMSSGYSRTFCFMRRDSSYLIGGGSKSIYCGDGQNLERTLWLTFKALRWFANTFCHSVMNSEALDSVYFTKSEDHIVAHSTCKRNWRMRLSYKCLVNHFQARQS